MYCSFHHTFMLLVVSVSSIADATDMLNWHSGPDEGQVARAKVLTEDLLEVVRGEHAKVKTMLQQQQMELHQAQIQYAAYSAYAVCIFYSFLSFASLLQLPPFRLGLYIHHVILLTRCL